MNIIILLELDKKDDMTYHLSDYRAEHICSVLKSQPNDRLAIGLLNGKRGSALVQLVSKDEVVLADLQLETVQPQKLTIDIIVALPRPQTVKKILFTSAMMGVRNIFFIKSNRVEKSFFHSPLLEEQNLQKHLIDGLQQGKNTMMPVVSIHDKFKPFMQDSLRLFYEERQELPTMLLPELDTEQMLSKVLNIGADEGVCRPQQLLIAIGPEGGWVPFEIEMMESLGFKKFKLGEWTLRVEHALTATLALIELLK